MNQRTKIILTFPYSGMEEIVEQYKKLHSVSILRLNEFLVWLRPYTEEEKQEWINEWNKDHLLSGDVAFKRIHGDELKHDIHRDYKERFLKSFYDEINKGTELIFIEATKDTLE